MPNLHYYSPSQDGLDSNPSQYKFIFKDHEFTFHTDNGVFSKNYIDYGSFVMLKEFKPNVLDAPILDMGAGYGPIGITISILYNREVVASEINQRAYELLNKNILTNKANVRALNANLYEGVAGEDKFASVVTNPPIRAGKQIVYAIYNGAYEHLLQDGELWVVIQKKQGAPSSKEYLTNLFGNCEIVARDAGYYILKCQKKK